MSENDSGIGSRELFDQLSEYHKEIVAYAETTTDNIATLKAATKIVNDQKETKWSKFKALIPIIILLLAVISLAAMKPLGVCEYSITLDKGFSAKACK